MGHSLVKDLLPNEVKHISLTLSVNQVDLANSCTQSSGSYCNRPDLIASERTGWKLDVKPEQAQGYGLENDLDIDYITTTQ